MARVIATGPAPPSRGAMFGAALGEGLGQGLGQELQTATQAKQLNPMREALLQELEGLEDLTLQQQMLYETVKDPRQFARTMQDPARMQSMVAMAQMAGSPEQEFTPVTRIVSGDSELNDRFELGLQPGERAKVEFARDPRTGQVSSASVVSIEQKSPERIRYEAELARMSPEEAAARKGSEESARLAVRRQHLKTVLGELGITPSTGANIFSGSGEDASASADTAAIMDLFNAAQRLAAGGETAMAGSLLAQARFYADHSPDIQRMKELNKPISHAVAAEMGVPVGTTLGEIIELIPRSPEEVAGATTESREMAKGRVDAREQIAFSDQAKGVITSLLAELETDPGLVGARGSLRATGKTAIGVLSDMGAEPILNAARNIALAHSDLGPDEYTSMFDSPTLSTLHLIENSVGLILARMRTPEGRVPVDVIKRSIDDMKLRGLTSSEQVQDRLRFIEQMIDVRSQGLRQRFDLADPTASAQESVDAQGTGEQPTAQKPTLWRQEDVDALPPGVEFTWGHDGNTYTKPAGE